MAIRLFDAARVTTSNSGFLSANLNPISRLVFGWLSIGCVMDLKDQDRTFGQQLGGAFGKSNVPLSWDHSGEITFLGLHQTAAWSPVPPRIARREGQKTSR